MTQNKRIVLNTIATYGRSMIGVLCGIFSTRWVLEALGQVDFGLYGLIGSLVIFISFINIQFSIAIARYYAYAIGEAKVADDKTYALEESRLWFSVAVAIHLILPTILVAIGYPLGVKRAEVYHYRLFCDEGWQPIMPRGEVYSTQFTELGWKSFSELHRR